MVRELVSIVIPTRNSALFLANCLRSIASQSYSPIEIIIVDGGSTDATVRIAEEFGCTLYTYKPALPKGLSDAPYKRNYGMERAKGIYAYWLDADMELPAGLIEEAVSLCKAGADALVIPEDSFGIGVWACAKQLERRCYWNDSTMESPRFFKKSAWDSIGGFDLSLGAGGDDIDLAQTVREQGYSIQRTKEIVRHNEGHLSVWRLFRKRFMYGREILNYFKKRPMSWIASYTPIKGSYARNWRLLSMHPILTLALIWMRVVEYAGGLLGFFYSFFRR